MLSRFSLGEIEDATKNFEKVLGQGGEAIVYLGEIPGFGKVAVKCLKSNLIKFEEEIEIVSKIKHPHLISLLGYCDESGQKSLVYEYMGKGSLYNYIKKDSKSTFCLSWQQRLYICLSAARGLQFLHAKTDELPKGIIHRDVKPGNILLNDDWVAKISDFGMCKLSHANQKGSTMITSLKGTSGYYAPEYVQYGSITRKIDVYAFGVVLFEALCQKMPWDRADESYYGLEDEDLGLWARENVDPDIIEEISEDCLGIFTHIIRRSLQKEPTKRPTMYDVVLDLEFAIKCQERIQERQDKGNRTKASTSGGKVSIPNSVPKMIQDIKEMEFTENGVDDEIYAILEECSMDPIQAIQKLLIKVRNPSKTTEELPDALKKPAGFLYVEVVEARDLEKLRGVGILETCVRVRLNDKPFQSNTTKMKEDYSNPRWNAEYKMLVKDLESQVVEFYVCDWDYDTMGMNFIPLKELIPDKREVFTLDLLKNMDPNGAENNKVPGKLVVQLIYKLDHEKNLSKYEELVNELDQSNYKDLRMQRTLEELSKNSTLLGGEHFDVKVYEAKDVEGKHHTNPVVKIFLEEQEWKSKCVAKNRDPKWDELCMFSLKEVLPTNEIMHVEVFSIPLGLGFLHPKESLGYVDIKLSDVVQHKRIKEWYHLIGSKYGSILIELRWRNALRSFARVQLKLELKRYADSQKKKNKESFLK